MSPQKCKRMKPIQVAKLQVALLEFAQNHYVDRFERSSFLEAMAKLPPPERLKLAKEVGVPLSDDILKHSQ